jgi:hypothetical protein
VWIIDSNDSTAGTQFFPIVNGSDTDFVHPFAMTILGNPADQLLRGRIIGSLSPLATKVGTSMAVTRCSSA